MTSIIHMKALIFPPHISITKESHFMLYLNRIFLLSFFIFSHPLFSSLEQSSCRRFHVFCSPFFITWTKFCVRRFHVFHSPFFITWTSFCFLRFHVFHSPFFHHVNRVFAFRFHVFSFPFSRHLNRVLLPSFPYFSTFLFHHLNRFFCSCFPFSFFITSGLLLWIRLRSRFSPLPLCWLFSLRLLNNEVRGWNRARLLVNKRISAATATLLKR